MPPLAGAHGEGGRAAGQRLGNLQYRFSRPSGTAFAVLFVIGVAEGAVEYARRSPVAERHVAGTNAITVHVLVAIAAAVAVIGIQAQRSRQPPGGDARPGPRRFRRAPRQGWPGPSGLPAGCPRRTWQGPW